MEAAPQGILAEVARPACSSSLSSRSLHLEDHITQEKFASIMQDFHQEDEKVGGAAGYRRLQDSKMTTGQFQVAISKLLGKEPDDEKIVHLCNKVAS